MQASSFSADPNPLWNRSPASFRRRTPWLVGSLLALFVCWALLWSAKSYWNPLFFFGVWTSATVLVRTLQGETPLPLPRQLVLMGLSVPMWWWFEFTNARAQNWQYQGVAQYGLTEYTLFASLAFSTVVPALDAAWHLSFKLIGMTSLPKTRVSLMWGVAEIFLGLAGQLLVFWLPTYFYPLIWVAPFLMLDGLMGLSGGPNLAREIAHGRWRLALGVGLAGVGCGLLWEFWNFWATPKWTYSVPFLHFLQIFEMPILGYLGYVPFAWCIFQLVQLARLARGKMMRELAPVWSRA